MFQQQHNRTPQATKFYAVVLISFNDCKYPNLFDRTAEIAERSLSAPKRHLFYPYINTSSLYIKYNVIYNI